MWLPISEWRPARPSFAARKLHDPLGFACESKKGQPNPVKERYRTQAFDDEELVVLCIYRVHQAAR
jgi:hypothetical protein